MTPKFQLSSSESYDEAMAEGLRERKKRQTRQHISDIATGLFLERGFVTVTIAEVAEAADVSVNTVYNYFPAKEDLFFDRSEGIVDRLSRCVRGRGAGASRPPPPCCANCARRSRRSRRAVGPHGGLRPTSCASSTRRPPCRSRLWRIQQEVLDHLEETLREETGAGRRRPAAHA